MGHDEGHRASRCCLTGVIGDSTRLVRLSTWQIFEIAEGLIPSVLGVVSSDCVWCSFLNSDYNDSLGTYGWTWKQMLSPSGLSSKEKEDRHAR